MWICEREIFQKNEGSRIWCRLCKTKPLLDNNIGNDHSRQTEENELRYGGRIDCEKFKNIKVCNGIIVHYMLTW